MTTPDSHYAISFRDPEEGEIVTLKARKVEDSELGLGFICISEFLFETRGSVVNPKEEDLARRFENVRRLHLNLYRILAIEERGAERLELEADRSRLVLLHPADDNKEK